MATLAPSTRSTTYTPVSPSAGPFIVGFPLFESDELRVTVNGTPTTAFTVSATYVDGIDRNATITFAAAQTGTIVIDGLISLDRQADLINGNPNLVSSLNAELTRVIAAGQETRRDASAALAAALASQAVSDDLEAAVATAEGAAAQATASAGAAASNAALLGLWRGAWATATVYAIGDRAQSGGSTYVCVVAHTSAGAFSTDLAAGRWQLFASKGDSGVGSGDVVSTNNLSDLTNAAVARVNLGLGTAAVLNEIDALPYRGEVSVATSFNDLTDHGYYLIQTNDMTNGPSDIGFSILTMVQTYRFGAAAHQIIYTFTGRTYWRYGADVDTTPVWSAWTRALVPADIDTNSNFSSGGTKITDRATIKTFVEAQKALTAMTQVAIAGGETNIDFTSIPAGVREIDVYFDGVSLSGTDYTLVQLGDSGGVELTGYVSGIEGSGGAVSSTAGFIFGGGAAAFVVTGTLRVRRIGAGNRWIAGGEYILASGAGARGAGSKTLSATLDRVRITRNGSNTFDAGFINLSYR